MRKCFVVTSFFLIAAIAYSWRFFGFFRCDQFLSVNKIVLASLDEYFSATFSNDRVVYGSLLHSSVEHDDFYAQTFHKVR